MKTFTAVLDCEGAPRGDIVWLTAEVRGSEVRLNGRPERRGLLGVYGDVRDPDRAAARLLRLAEGFEGVYLDLEGEQAAALARQLAPTLGRNCQTLCAPLSAHAEGAVLTVPSAVSGGSLSGLLDELIARYGADRLCLELVRSRALFEMPSRDPDGEALTEERLRALLSKAGTPYFSPALCARYATFPEDGKARLILFDDRETAEAKERLAREKGLWATVRLREEWA